MRADSRAAWRMTASVPGAAVMATMILSDVSQISLG